jgi:dTDP-4-amino-4,6-dideoxygalactose transaminase
LSARHPALPRRPSKAPRGFDRAAEPVEAKAPANSKDPIFVTRPFLPPLSEFVPYLERIWASGVLTNGGDFHAELEAALCRYLGVEHVSLFANGTLALLTALQALRISGEVITTPYSFVATAHSLLWNGIRPVFIDVEPDTLNLDPARIEAAITPRTTAILPVHCYGRPCQVDRIGNIADNYGLKVIYDAAHAFGVRIGGTSVLRSGDVSVLSFHATKVFTTFEGGAVISGDAKTKQRIDRLKNFGILDEVTVVAPGINGKMNEVQAAFGLLQLQHVDEAIARRARIDAVYRDALGRVEGITCLPAAAGATPNHSYFPILVDERYGETRDELYERLRGCGIYARRYFYPLISDFPMYRELPSADRANLPVAALASERILCLPIYPTLEPHEQDLIVHAIMARR